MLLSRMGSALFSKLTDQLEVVHYKLYELKFVTLIIVFESPKSVIINTLAINKELMRQTAYFTGKW